MTTYVVKEKEHLTLSLKEDLFSFSSFGLTRLVSQPPSRDLLRDCVFISVV